MLPWYYAIRIGTLQVKQPINGTDHPHSVQINRIPLCWSIAIFYLQFDRWKVDFRICDGSTPTDNDSCWFVIPDRCEKVSHLNIEKRTIDFLVLLNDFQ